MKSQTMIQSWPVRMGCSTLKGGDAHGGKQALGFISASTMKAVYSKGILMPEQIQTVPIEYHNAKGNLQEAANSKITQTKTDRNCGHKEKTMKKEIFENKTSQEQATPADVTGEGADNNPSDLVEGEIAAIVAQADSEALEESSTETVIELPPGVTEAPQDEEHMDLSRIAGYSRWVKCLSYDLI